MADTRELKLLLTMKDKMSRQLDTAGKKTTKLSSNVKKLGAAILGAFAIRAITRFIGESVRLFGIQEKAEARLTNIMMSVNQATQEQVQSLKDYARELQQITTFGDEQTISAMAMLGTFQLNTEQIKQLIPRIIDMGAAMEKSSGAGTDLESITIAVGKAMTMGIGSLSRYGVVITDVQKEAFLLADKQGKLDIITKALDANFKGIAEGSAKTLTGSLEKLKNVTGDFKEMVGKAALVLTKELVFSLGMNIQAMNQNEAQAGSLIISINKLKLNFYSLGTGIVNTALKLKRAGAVFNKYTIGFVDDLLGGVDGMKYFQDQIDAIDKQTVGYDNTLGEMVLEIDNMNEELKAGTFNWDKFTGSVLEAGAGASSAAGDVGELGKELEESAKKVEKFRDELIKLNEKYAEDTNEVADNYGEAFINQEEKVANLRKQIGEETDAVKKSQLETELARELEALEFFSHRYRQYEAEIAEERKWRTKTDFEQTMIELSNTKNKLIEEFEAKKKKIEDELKLEVEKLSKIKEIDNIALIQQDKFLAESEIAHINSANKNIATYNEIANAISKASRGITSSNVSIDPNITQRSNQGVPILPWMQNINITVNGDVSGQDLINKVGESIMGDLRLNSKLGF